MSDYDIVFEFVRDALQVEATEQASAEPSAAATTAEYDDIEELVRFAAELSDPVPARFTISGL